MAFHLYRQWVMIYLHVLDDLCNLIWHQVDVRRELDRASGRTLTHTDGKLTGLQLALLEWSREKNKLSYSLTINDVVRLVKYCCRLLYT